MTKEQKQKVILAGIVGLAVLYALKQFALTPLLESRGKLNDEFEAMKSKLMLANGAIKNEGETRRRLAETQAQLMKAQSDLLPSADNALSWATKTIYHAARSVGLDLESVSETETDRTNFTAKDQVKRAFKPYAVRMSVECGYPQLIELIKSLEDANPYLCVTGIQIQCQPQTPERHQISIVVEWPTWKDPNAVKPYQGGAANES